MIVTSLKAIAYRVHSPRWSVAPTSGAGAAKFGGRVNRAGTEALYLSLEDTTALAEYKQLDDLLPPGLIVSYQIELDHVVDFTKGYDKRWDPLWQDFYCDWRKMIFQDKIEPPSWIIGDQVITAGAKGILFASALVKGGTNLVIYNGSLADTDSLVVHDPHNALPVNQSSWQ